MTDKQKVEKVFTDRGFQPREHSTRNIIGDFLLPSKPHVTAIGTSGGKTFTTAGRLEFLYKYGHIKQDESVLILAADKTILRGNFVEQFTEFFKDVPASFTWRGVSNKKELKSAIEDGVQVIITLPQTLNDSKKLEILKKHKVTWFIQDEAHRWYFKKTIQRILKTIKPKYQSLLTGTPFKFNFKKDDFIFDYTPVAEMYGNGYLSDFTAQVLHSSVELTKIDYVSLLGNLKDAKRLSEDDVIQSFNGVVNEIIKKLKLPFKGLATTHNVSKNITSVFGKLEKTIIFTHGTSEANYLHAYLQTTGVKSLISHSNLKVDDAEKTFNEFKTDDEIKILVAVNRGKEGFDFPELYNVIDMTYSQNFEVVMQIIGRILRKSDKIKNKYFFKVAPKNTAGYFKDWMNALFMLFEKEWYSKYDGKNGFDIKIPNTLLKQNGNKNKSNKSQKVKYKKSSIQPQSLEFSNSLQFMQDNKWFKLDDSISTVASTTLRRVYETHGLFKKNKFLTKDEIIPIALKYKTRTEFHESDYKAWSSAYRMGFIDEVCSHMKPPRVIWTKEKLKKEAFKYKTKKDFLKKSNSAYNSAYKKGILDEICSHMSRRLDYTINDIKIEALKYKTRTEFQKNSKLYAAARTLNIIDDVCSHMKPTRNYWTDEQLIKIGKKYNSKKEFYSEQPQAYQAAYKRKLFNLMHL